MKTVQERISDDEYSGKYRHVARQSGGKCFAMISYDDYGDIIAEQTYTDDYCRRKKLGKYASSSSSSDSKKSESKKGFFGKLFG